MTDRKRMIDFTHYIPLVYLRPASIRMPLESYYWQQYPLELQGQIICKFKTTPNLHFNSASINTTVSTDIRTIKLLESAETLNSYLYYYYYYKKKSTSLH